VWRKASALNGLCGWRAGSRLPVSASIRSRARSLVSLDAARALYPRSTPALPPLYSGAVPRRSAPSRPCFRAYSGPVPAVRCRRDVGPLCARRGGLVSVRVCGAPCSPNVGEARRGEARRVLSKRGRGEACLVWAEGPEGAVDGGRWRGRGWWGGEQWGGNRRIAHGDPN
jgi:hypothetical protein